MKTGGIAIALAGALTLAGCSYTPPRTEHVWAYDGISCEQHREAYRQALDAGDWEAADAASDALKECAAQRENQVLVKREIDGKFETIFDALEGFGSGLRGG